MTRAIKPDVHITAITGGIGSGKSVVSHILRVMGYSVYDCDSEAKKIMDADAELIQNIAHKVHDGAVRADGTLDRQELGRVVFSDAERMAVLNSLVHDAVKRHFLNWCSVKKNSDRIFVETAILMTSGMDSLVDDVWIVTAPEDVRIQRVMTRNGLSAQMVKTRMRAQDSETEALKHFNGIKKYISNTDSSSLIGQILSLL